MFPRTERLSRAALTTRHTTRRLASAHLSATEPKTKGYAVIISKKTLPRAVDRHALKRRVLAALRRLPQESRPPGLILYPKASALALRGAALMNELKELLGARK